MREECEAWSLHLYRNQFSTNVLCFTPCVCENFAGPSSRDREHLREIQVKVHIRRPEKDSWVYLGRGTVLQEINGHSSRVGSYLS